MGKVFIGQYGLYDREVHSRKFCLLHSSIELNFVCFQGVPAKPFVMLFVRWYPIEGIKLEWSAKIDNKMDIVCVGIACRYYFK